MKIILKYLKPFILLVILCVSLLFVQAVCELTLPNLMSDLVNTGIQYGGVDDASPAALSARGYDLLSYFLTDADRELFASCYTLTTPEDGSELAEKYPLLETQSIYVRNEELSEDELNQVQRAYGTASLAFVNYMQELYAGYSAQQPSAQPDSSDAASDMTPSESGDSANTPAFSYDAESGFSDINISALYDQLLPAFAAMPSEAFDNAINSASAVDSSISVQIGTTFTRLFYNELGVDMVATQKNYITDTGVHMLAIALLSVIAAVGVGFFSSKISSSIARKMRHDIFVRVSDFSGAEFDGFSTASLITRTTNDVQQVQMLIMMGIRMICFSPIMGIGGIVMALNKSVSMSWLIAAAVVIMFGIILVMFAVAMPRFKMLQKLIDKLNLVSRESLSGVMVIRAFGNETYEENRFERANRDLTDTNRFVLRAMSAMMPAMTLVMNLVTLAIVWVGAKAIEASTLQIGDMMAFIQYAMHIIISFLMIAAMFIMVPRAAVSAERISEVLSCKPTILDKPKVIDPPSVKGDIKFENVSFKYSNAEHNVLENISFEAHSGETTAFIGSTGSGKSTLINLIPRFYDVTGGRITIDGVDIRDFSQHYLREIIGYIPQKGLLFSGDIASNIRYGAQNASDREVVTAIEVAQAKDFLDGTADGLRTPIAQGGTNVSGGQKQRLSIARALVKKPPIYIFDDSFSALDFKTDAALRKALAQHTGDSTVLIVAQRVSTIMNADRIIVLDSGHMVGSGTHRELLLNCPEYREIAESQLSKEELA